MSVENFLSGTRHNCSKASAFLEANALKHSPPQTSGAAAIAACVERASAPQMALDTFEGAELMRRQHRPHARALYSELYSKTTGVEGSTPLYTYRSLPPRDCRALQLYRALHRCRALQLYTASTLYTLYTIPLEQNRPAVQATIGFAAPQSVVENCGTPSRDA